jgi:hypothetical protein
MQAFGNGPVQGLCHIEKSLILLGFRIVRRGGRRSSPGGICRAPGSSGPRPAVGAVIANPLRNA